jgi:hypothetical protein
VPKVATASKIELQQIGRRLCGQIGVTPPKQVTSTTLRQVADAESPRVDEGLVIAIRACADGLAELERAPEVQELGRALEAYGRWWDQSREVRGQLQEALARAMPLLDEEAKVREEALASLPVNQRGIARTWPSSHVLRAFPRELYEVIPRTGYALGWLMNILLGLARLDDNAGPRIAYETASPWIRMTKGLRRAGYRPAKIASILYPSATSGPARTQARNKVTARRKLRVNEERIVKTFRNVLIAGAPGAPDLWDTVPTMEHPVPVPPPARPRKRSSPKR